MTRYLTKQSFTKSWRLLGKPTLRVIQPITQWRLPPGVYWEDNYNQFLNTAGRSIVIDWRFQPYATANFLPRPSTTTLRLEVPGVIQQESTEVTLLWSAELEAAVRAAWGIAIGSQLFRLRQVTLRPLGVPAPTALELSLVEASDYPTSGQVMLDVSQAANSQYLPLLLEELTIWS